MRAKPLFSGEQYGRLTAVEYIRDGRNTSPSEAYWKWQCSCGKVIEAIVFNVRRGNTNSCGCYMRQRVSETQTTHGLSKSSREQEVYFVWKDMRNRCSNPNNDRYADYGGRGIKVCPTWEDFLQFKYDMGERPTPDHSIERIDNNGNYTPTNCKWATAQEQALNRRPKFHTILDQI
jgi:hypothetical protein